MENMYRVWLVDGDITDILNPRTSALRFDVFKMDDVLNLMSLAESSGYSVGIQSEPLDS